MQLIELLSLQGLALALFGLAVYGITRAKYENEIIEVLTEVKDKHAHTVAMAIENAYNVGYKDGRENAGR